MIARRTTPSSAAMTAPAMLGPDGPPRTPREVAAWAGYLTQVQAAAYLGVSVRWFRDNVDVQPVPMGLPRPGKRPLLRYRRVDLDAWVERCRTHKLPRAK
jgi:hypothetical protein